VAEARGVLPLGLALISIAAVLLPAPGMFVAMSAGIAGVGLGVLGSRRGRGAARLACAAGTALAGCGLLLAVARYALTLAALDRLVALAG
jgi:hypothetical protein